MDTNQTADIAAVARQFVLARAEGRSLPEFPGPLPTNLAEAYSIQDAAINLWQDEIAGWKVGRILEPLAQEFGTDRLVGPIFKGHVVRAGSAETIFSVFEAGFGAVEAEFVLEIGADAPEDKTSWTVEEAHKFISAVYIGVEIASSPLASINQIGPKAIVSDFGNNASLIVGPKLSQWQSRPLNKWQCETFIDGKSVGTGNASTMPGGPFESARCLLELSARRGMPLKAGCLVSSGAITGVHDILPGQSSHISFGDDGEIFCSATAGGAESPAFLEALKKA